ncbi:glutamyl-tRNA(Gln) amidotransferase subunit C, chloroplastic/mitochondrial [Asparagus officinalis]|uniref:glutamyl-tRNA(Gln) amidotransferase subunit C, chloroplastic/mitochondrial n=1 Tax=Asparagus officinalis TaxID=4686 RepID=UPI00098E7168|nr:glutamyl-tRNA(Gln) amidotransferase subunit C, chloroplastic/mitochondrial [Asparagus officinalis]
MLSLVGGSSVLFRVPIAMGSSTKLWSKCSSSVARCSTLEPPDVAKLAETARINLAPREVEDFAPKINQVIDWFGQLQAVDLQSIEPSLRSDTELSTNPREDIPEPFTNREAILAEIPSFSDPYIKVPKVLNKE